MEEASNIEASDDGVALDTVLGIFVRLLGVLKTKPEAERMEGGQTVSAKH